AGGARRYRERHRGAAQPCRGGEPGARRLADDGERLRLAAADRRHAQDRLRPAAARDVPPRHAARRGEAAWARLGHLEAAAVEDDDIALAAARAKGDVAVLAPYLGADRLVRV